MNNIKLYISILTVAFFGLFASFYLYRVSYYKEMAHAKEGFTQQTQNFLISINEHEKRFKLLMRGVRSYFIGSNTVTQDEWDAYCKSLDLSKEFVSVRFISVIRSVTKNNKEATLADISANGVPNFKIWPVSERDRMLPMLYISPISYTNWVGFDICQDETVCSAAFKSEESGEIIGTPAATVSQGEVQKTLFKFLLPIKKPNLPIFGWVMTLVDLATVLDVVTTELKLQQINIQVYDGKEINSQKLVISRVSNPDPNPLFIESRVISMGGKDWTLVFSTGPGYKVRINSFQPVIILVVSLTALLFLILLMICISVEKKMEMANKERAQMEVEETIAYRQSILESASYSIICTDKEGKILLFNRAAEKLTGYTAAEMIGKETPLILHDPEEIKERAKELSELFGRTIVAGKEVFDALAERGIPDERDWHYIRKDKSRVLVTLIVNLVKDTKGNFLGYMGIAKEKK